MDGLGVQFIEGGWPGANPKDIEFFRMIKTVPLQTATVVAFGSTRKSSNAVQKDPNIRALLEAETTIITLFGKTWSLHVTDALGISLAKNLELISDSVAHLRSKGRRVFYDAEHFFDGYRTNPDYALETIRHAVAAGAERVILCDTNGGSMPWEIKEVCQIVRRECAVPLGIHAHNDCEMAVANSLVAIETGVVQVQGTINGIGERCGNANLCSIIPALKLKMGIDCITDRQLAKLTEVSHYVSELANLIPDAFAPYVGASAFSHKAGYHVAGLTKWADAYQHIDPAQVGNKPKVLVSELSGKRNIIYKAKELRVDLPPKGKAAQKLVKQVKLLESRGFQYENAEASFELLLHRAKLDYKPPFELVDFMVVVEKKRRRPSTQENLEEMLSEAVVKVKVDNEVVHTAAEGNGPVNALDQALRKALLRFYPSIATVRLVDYKVRILEESIGTGSQVRVLIESTDGVDEWRTVGSSTNIIEASWLALADSLEYWLIKQKGVK